MTAIQSTPHGKILRLWWRYTSPGGWTEYRRIQTNEIAWFQRFFEAWWILTGKHSFDRVYRSSLAKSRIMYGRQ